MSEHLHTVCLAVDPLQPASEPIAQAAALIRQGKLVAFPTETVYGLGANALDAAAVARIFVAKQRPTSDPLIVHIAALSQLDQVARELPPIVHALARRFWPGPLTLVLPRHPGIPPNVSAGMDTVAVRMPDHPVAVALIAAAGVPIAAPSANRFTRPSPTTAQHVLDDLAGRIAMVVDGGPTRIGLESTIVSLLDARPALLRPGGVPIEDLRMLLPDLVYEPRYFDLEAGARATAPGMLLKHYAPDAEVLLFRGPHAAVLAAIQRTAADRRAVGQRVGMLLVDEDVALLNLDSAVIGSLGSGTNLAEVGARLFAGLRALEGQVDVILVRGFEQAGLGLAIWDRLLRATEGRVIDIS